MSNLSSTLSSRAHCADQVFREVHLADGEIVSSEFYDCVFVRCSFVESVFRNCSFVNCSFRQCDLSLVQVPGSRFSSTRFENSKIIGVNWTEADWPSAGLGDPIGFRKCAMSHSTFLGLSLKGIHIKHCVAVDVDFREVDLSQADFGGTDLSKSMFGKTDLSEADLSCARNYSIDPGRNVLKGAKFSLPEAMSLLHSMDIVLVEES